MKKLISLFLIVTMLFTVGCTPLSDKNSSDGTFVLTFITIGKGDAFILESPLKKYYLVDTGKAEDFQQIIRTLRLKGINHLDGIFLSHGHKDHAGCLEPILDDMPVESVYISAKDTISYKEIKPEIIVPQYEKTTLVKLKGGEKIDLGGAEAEIWIPSIADKNNENNNSMIMRITHGNNSFLLMGDAELEEEHAFMQTKFPLKSKVLKLGHHGETDATSPEFLNRVSPEIAVISGNAEENPDSENAETAFMLDKNNIDYYYSKGSSLDFCSDGKEIEIIPLVDNGLEKTADLSISDISRKKQAVKIKNNSDKDINAEGCFLISKRGDEIYRFPENTILKADEEITIVCRDSSVEGDLVWDCDSVWRKHDDTALLYDKNMNLMDSDLGN